MSLYCQQFGDEIKHIGKLGQSNGMNAGMDENRIDDIALSVVREYLSSKKLLKALNCLDEERPRREGSISKRSVLVQTLSIEKLLKKSKEEKQPLQTILEVLVRQHLDLSNTAKVKNNFTGSKFNPISQENTSKKADKTKQQKMQPNTIDNILDKKPIHIKTLPFECESASQSKSTLQSFSISNDYDRENLSIPSSSGSVRSSVVCGDLSLDDFDDNDFEVGFSFTNKRSGPAEKNLPKDTPISKSVAKELKSLIFGSCVGSFNGEWRKQNLNFSTVCGLRYGLVQKKGGPCGILASLQSYIILELLYPKTGKPIGLNPNNDQQNFVLKQAIRNILWKIGDYKEATVAVFLSKFSLHNSDDKDPESLITFRCNSLEKLEKCISKHLSLFRRENDSGCISLLCSALLTRGIQNVRSDMDESNGSIIGAHGYCTQEIVNLFLTGRAKSNVFDGVIKLESGGDEASFLHGIDSQSEIGFLSLYEHYESCKVGSNMKNPIYPIWVVCSESHFTLLFSTNAELTQPNWLELKKFELIYYDSFGNQDTEIKLIIDAEDNSFKDHDDELIPPLEHCIRTKWPGATITWKGSEPLL